eukprot:CAMPEP_0117025414 /NCGR_PEP_ID=MMETSP0472-20121206/18774_1 /TAXON_ID=693140 ORGANISM="Tiarina fusus, Strain LIS" /NCGR_SAMPLE_ID=MMETSP0472 /ASSEMBLY_ACC=CAM_ASM_000603 /LENGTH=70 /DNA_ID=CAMNT_0004732119 /DNA_START=53 /DNA_END=265 /DNA_ORIENTATION=+
MALRRPATRVELKADDIEEYNEIMREREMAMEDTNASPSARYLGGRPRSAKSSNLRKKSTSERIGIGRPR